MRDVAVPPATPGRFDDALAAIGGGGGEACCCRYRRLSSSDYGRSSVEERRAALRAHGVARALLGGGVEYARAEGAPAPEA